MKNILYSLLAFILLSNTAFAQLITDEQHRTMMNNYTTALNNILTPYATQQGITIDQLKKNIVNGQFSLANELYNIATAANPLRTYGYQFASAKGLTILPNDNRAYFYSTFMPSTVVSNGKLVENITTGITATGMWECALSNFSTNDCGGSILTNDKTDIYKLATAGINKLNANTMNILLMVNGFSDCMNIIPLINNVRVISSFLEKNKGLIDENVDALSRVSDTELIPLMQSLGFQDVQILENIGPSMEIYVQKFSEIATYEKNTYNLSSIEEAPIYRILLGQIGGQEVYRAGNKKCNRRNLKNWITIGGTCSSGADIGIVTPTHGIRFLPVTIKEGTKLIQNPDNPDETITCGCGENGGHWEWFWETLF